MAAGRLFGIGVGPGDPELMTVKAVRLVQAAGLVVSFSAEGRPSIARSAAAAYLGDGQAERRLCYPVTVESPPADWSYDRLLARFYDEAAAGIAADLQAGVDVAVLCEGDPFFYGSFMYLHDRLSHRFKTAIIPGIVSFSAAAAAAGMPLVFRNEALAILSGVLPEAELERRLAASDAAVVLKLGAISARSKTCCAAWDWPSEPFTSNGPAMPASACCGSIRSTQPPCLIFR